MAALDNYGRTFLRSRDQHSVLTQEGLTILVMKGSIAEQDADAVVASVSWNLDLKQGALSKVLLEKAGPKLQEELKAACPGKMQHGDVMVTDGLSLPASFVFYGVLKRWDKGKDDAEQVYRAFVRNSLIKGNEMRLKSIAIPAMGTGVLNFSSEQIIDYLFSEVDLFSSTNSEATLEEIRFVVYERDQKTFEAFEQKLEQIRAAIQDKEDSDQMIDENEILQLSIMDQLKTVYPSSWKQTSSGNQYETTLLDWCDSEFQMVSKRIMETLENTLIRNILKIERIENRTLYQLYTVFKSDMEKRNGKATENERILWHGTAKESIANICMGGFTRSYRGNNTALYGEGVHFARDFEYSAHSKCSPPDSDGTKYVFMCAVLTGTFIVGNDEMVEPDVNPATGFRHDSTVDVLKSPRIFVIYKDAQAYPQYLVSFN